MTADRSSPFGGLRTRAIALLGVLAIAIQCLVVQTHVHAWADPGASQAQIASVDASNGASTSADPSAPASPHRHGGSTLCYICQTAVAGTAILTAAPSLNFVEILLVAPVVAPQPSAPAVSSPSHIWRSRAPPIQL